MHPEMDYHKTGNPTDKVPDYHSATIANLKQQLSDAGEQIVALKERLTAAEVWGTNQEHHCIEQRKRAEAAEAARDSLAEQLRVAREALEDADFALYRAIFPDSDGADYRRCIGARPKVQAALTPPAAQKPCGCLDSQECDECAPPSAPERGGRGHERVEEFYEKPSAPANLCDTCPNEFATCGAKRIVFGIDRDPSARGADADKVLECDQYKPSAPEECEK